MTERPVEPVQTATAFVFEGPTPGSGEPGPSDAGAPSREGRWAVLGTTSLAHFVNDGTVFFIPVMADRLASRGHLSATEVTVMLTVFYLSSALAGIAVGRLADRAGSRGAKMALGILGLAAGLTLFFAAAKVDGAALRVALALMAALVAGVGSSTYHPLGATLITDAFAPANRARALGANGALGSLGRALYPTIFFSVTGLLASQASALVVFAVIATGAAALLWMARTDAAPRSPRRAQRPSAAKGGWLDRNVTILTVVSLLRSVAFTGMVAWLPTYFTRERSLGLSTELGLMVTLLYAGGIVGQPVFGLLADRVDKRLMLAVATLGAAATTFGYLHTGGALGLVLLGAFGVFNFSGFPLLMSLVADYVPKGGSTTANAFVWGLGSTGGQAIGPLVIGLLALSSYRNLAGSFEILAVIAVVGLFGLLLMSKTEQHSKPQLFG